MASFGSGFAAGLNSGMSMGKMLMDTYNENKLKRDVEDASALDQQVVDGGLSDEQKAQIQATRDQKLEDGTAAYEVEDVGNGVRIRAAGTPDGEWGLVSGKKSYSLGGKTQDTEFTPEQISRARNDAIATAYTKNGDPVRGLQYKNAAREDRTASALEAAREEYMAGLEDMASGQGMEKYIPMILRAYNDPRNGSKHDDGHNATYDPERNVVAFSDKDGRIVNTFPVNQQTMAAAWKERYLDKIEAFDPKLGLERGKITETGRHNRAIEGIYSEKNDIDRSRVGLLGGKGQPGSALGMTDDGKGVVYNTPQGLVVKPLPAGVDGAKLFPKVTGLKGDEAQVEYDDGAGTKIKGTPGQVHNSRMKIDGTYRAANGGDLSMPPPASNQTGRAAAAPGKAPAKQSGISDAELNTMISDAERGGKTGTAYLNEALSSGELNMSQRQRVEKALKTPR
jgi:hypothetical protein